MHGPLSLKNKLLSTPLIQISKTSTPVRSRIISSPFNSTPINQLKINSSPITNKRQNKQNINSHNNNNKSLIQNHSIPGLKQNNSFHNHFNGFKKITSSKKVVSFAECKQQDQLPPFQQSKAKFNNNISSCLGINKDLRINEDLRINKDLVMNKELNLSPIVALNKRLTTMREKITNNKNSRNQNNTKDTLMNSNSIVSQTKKSQQISQKHKNSYNSFINRSEQQLRSSSSLKSLIKAHNKYQQGNNKNISQVDKIRTKNSVNKSQKNNFGCSGTFSSLSRKKNSLNNSRNRVNISNDDQNIKINNMKNSRSMTSLFFTLNNNKIKQGDTDHPNTDSRIDHYPINNYPNTNNRIEYYSPQIIIDNNNNDLNVNSNNNNNIFSIRSSQINQSNIISSNNSQGQVIYCSNNHNKLAKYKLKNNHFLQQNSNLKFMQQQNLLIQLNETNHKNGFCSKCAIDLIQHGFNVEQIYNNNINTTRQNSLQKQEVYDTDKNNKKRSVVLRNKQTKRSLSTSSLSLQTSPRMNNLGSNNYSSVGGMLQQSQMKIINYLSQQHQYKQQALSQTKYEYHKRISDQFISSIRRMSNSMNDIERLTSDLDKLKNKQEQQIDCYYNSMIAYIEEHREKDKVKLQQKKYHYQQKLNEYSKLLENHIEQVKQIFNKVHTNNLGINEKDKNNTNAYQTLHNLNTDQTLHNLNNVNKQEMIQTKRITNNGQKQTTTQQKQQQSFQLQQLKLCQLKSLKFFQLKSLMDKIQYQTQLYIQQINQISQKLINSKKLVPIKQTIQEQFDKFVQWFDNQGKLTFSQQQELKLINDHNNDKNTNNHIVSRCHSDTNNSKSSRYSKNISTNNNYNNNNNSNNINTINSINNYNTINSNNNNTINSNNNYNLKDNSQNNNLLGQYAKNKNLTTTNNNQPKRLNSNHPLRFSFQKALKLQKLNKQQQFHHNQSSSSQQKPLNHHIKNNYDGNSFNNNNTNNQSDSPIFQEEEESEYYDQNSFNNYYQNNQQIQQSFNENSFNKSSSITQNNQQSYYTNKILPNDQVLQQQAQRNENQKPFRTLFNEDDDTLNNDIVDNMESGKTTNNQIYSPMFKAI